MPQNRVLVPAVLASAVLALVPLQLISEAQERAPARLATGMEVYSGAPVEGRQPVREFGGGKQE